MTTRYEHVDIAKGISILLVVTYHSNITRFYPETMDSIGLFRMPLFFFLSGLFFKYDTPAGSFFTKKLDALIKPYFFTLLWVWLVVSLWDGSHAYDGFLGILYGDRHTISITPLWFLTHLFAVYCFAYSVIRLAKMYRWPAALKMLLIVLQLLIGGYFIGYFWDYDLVDFEVQPTYPGLPFSLDVILVTSSFFLAGWFSKDRVISFSPKIVLAVLSLIAFLLVTCFSDAYIDFAKRSFISPALCMIAAFSGIYLVLTLSVMLVQVAEVKNTLVNYGKSSLFVLLFHHPIGIASFLLLLKVFGDEYKLLLALVSFTLSAVVPIYIMRLISGSSLLSLFYYPLSISSMALKPASSR